MMIIGLDLDNTIICYDGLFYQRALELECIPPSLARDKESVSAYLKSNGKNDVWTQMQAEIYGPNLGLADPFPGALEFLRRALERGVSVHIISHKTRAAAADPETNLQDAARGWLRARGFLGGSSGDPEVFFAETRAEKLARIAATGCTLFLDDLPAVFDEAAFPAATRKFLFDPNDRFSNWKDGTRISSWNEFSEEALPTP